MKVNIAEDKEIRIDGEPLDEVDSFTYLGSILDKKGGADMDIKSRSNKARITFIQLNKIWSSKIIGRETKTRIFNSNVKSVLLYGAETWRATKNNIKLIQTFVNRCLRKILNIHWSEIISNEELWHKTKQKPLEEEICRRRWKWIGHTLRKNESNTTREALSWKPQGHRKRGRPRTTWKRTVEKEIGRIGKNWKRLRS